MGRRTLVVLSFATAALLLAALGTYSVIAYAVSRRRNEIGIRMALGASPRNALTMILRQGLRPVLNGLAAGALAAFVFGGLLFTLLFSVSARDPAIFAIVSAITVAAAACACCIPARRAAKKCAARSSKARVTFADLQMYSALEKLANTTD